MRTSGFSNREAPSTSQGRHFYQFYKGREDLFHITIPFLKLGLENKEACLWIVSKAIGILEAVEAFQRQCNLTQVIETGQLLFLPVEKWYLEDGRFSERKALKIFRSFIEEKTQQGFTSFRGVGDVGALGHQDWASLQSYEKKIQEHVKSIKITALCVYPIESRTLVQTKDVLDNHDTVFLTKL